MRILILIFCFLIPINSWAALDYEKGIARELIAKAVLNPSVSLDTKLLSRIYQRIDQVKVKIASEGRDFPYCLNNPGATGFHQKRKMRDIYICNLTLTMSAYDVAQTIIHETIHSLDIYNECETSRTEVAIMRASLGKVAYRNKYWKSCGIF